MWCFNASSKLKLESEADLGIIERMFVIISADCYIMGRIWLFWSHWMSCTMESGEYTGPHSPPPLLAEKCATTQVRFHFPWSLCSIYIAIYIYRTYDEVPIYIYIYITSVIYNVCSNPLKLVVYLAYGTVEVRLKRKSSGGWTALKCRQHLSHFSLGLQFDSTSMECWWS